MGKALLIETSVGVIAVPVPVGGFTGWLPVANAAFRESNTGRHQGRSMSVGDWLLIGGSLYWVASAGFSESPIPRFGIESLGYIPVSSMEAALAS